MNCNETREHVSALHDGETIPAVAAVHITECATCRQKFREYAEIRVELRLAASIDPSSASPLGALPERGAHWSGLWSGRVQVPRFAVMLAGIAIAGLALGLGFVQAQQRGPWFRYQIGLPTVIQKARVADSNHLLREGFREVRAFPGDEDTVVAEVEVVGFRRGAVKMEVRAARLAKDAAGEAILEGLAAAPRLELLYVPGGTLEIALPGGGALWLRGEVLADRPARRELEFPAFGNDQFALASPSLVRGHRAFTPEDSWAGGSIVATSDDPGLALDVDGVGRFLIALRPFDGAVEGEVNGSCLRWSIAGEEYVLYSAAGITGGPYPRPIWVRQEASVGKPGCRLCVTASTLDLLLEQADQR